MRDRLKNFHVVMLSADRVIEGLCPEIQLIDQMVIHFLIQNNFFGELKIDSQLVLQQNPKEKHLVVNIGVDKELANPLNEDLLLRAYIYALTQLNPQEDINIIVEPGLDFVMRNIQW